MVSAKTGNCFLCNYNFKRDEETWTIFDANSLQPYNIRNSLSYILSSALECEINESSTHSNSLCEACKMLALEYFGLQQSLIDVQKQIINIYKSTIEFHASAAKDIEIIEDLQMKENITNNVVDDDVNLLVENVKDDADTDESTFFKYDTEINESDMQNDVFESFQSIPILSTIVSLDSNDNIFANNEDIKDGNAKNIENEIFNDYSEEIETPVDEDDDENSPNYEDTSTTSFSSKRTARKDSDDSYKSTSDSRKIFKCYKCKKVLSSKRCLQSHMMRHKEPKFQCDICGKWFFQEQNLNIHKMRHSNFRTKYQCKICQKILYSKYTHKYHMESHNPNVYVYKCEICHKVFHNENGFKQHKNRHTNKKIFHCDTCGKSFNYKQNLDQHKEIHFTRHTKICECDICGKRFSTVRYLMTHKKRHLVDNVAPQIYECKICGKTIKTKYGPRLLAIHMRSHEVRDKDGNVVFKNFAKKKKKKARK